MNDEVGHEAASLPGDSIIGRDGVEAVGDVAVSWIDQEQGATGVPVGPQAANLPGDSIIGRDGVEAVGDVAVSWIDQEQDATGGAAGAPAAARRMGQAKQRLTLAPRPVRHNPARQVGRERPEVPRRYLRPRRQLQNDWNRNL